jgi:hypothetical protein
MSDAVEKIEWELNYEWRQLREPGEWIPAFVDVGGYKSLDIERLEDDMDHRAWGYYRAGQIEAYGKALRELEKRDGE